MSYMGTHVTTSNFETLCGMQNLKLNARFVQKFKFGELQLKRRILFPILLVILVILLALSGCENQEEESASTEVNLSKTSVSVTEGGANDSFTVVLSTQPEAGNVVVIDVTGTSDVEIDKDGGVSYTTGTESLTFNSTNWNITQTITVRAYDDSDAESSETDTITIVTNDGSTSENSYDAVDPMDVSVTVTDNDSPGVSITVSDGSTAVTEGGTTDTFTVVLSKAPVGSNVVVIDVTGTSDVEIDKDGGASYTTGTESLTFNGTNWDSPQTIIVRAYDDDIYDDGETGTITIVTNDTSTTEDSYDTVDPMDVDVTVTDNDSAGVTIDESGGSTAVTEGGTVDTFTIVLDSQPEGSNVVVIEVTGTSDVEIDKDGGASYTTGTESLTFNGTNWDSPQTIIVRAYDDDIDDDGETGTITIATNDTNTTEDSYDTVDPMDVSVTVTDND